MGIGDAGDTFTRMLHALDAKDWSAVRREFADMVDLDYSSLFGGPPVHIDADEQVAGWARFVGAFDATQHMTGPIVVTASDTSATAHTHVRGYHRLHGAEGGDIWMVAGHYAVKLVRTAAGWKISGITLTVFYQEGNLRMPEIARARAASDASS